MPAKPAPKARLGESVASLPPPPKRGEPLNIVVARSKVAGGKLHLSVEAPKLLRGYPGAKVLVKHVYRLQEDTTEREEYRILLRSSLNGKEHPPSLARFGDSYALPDDHAGFVVHEHTLPASGEALLRFEVGAEYTVGSWKTEQVDVHEQEQRSGEVRIQLT